MSGSNTFLNFIEVLIRALIVKAEIVAREKDQSNERRLKTIEFKPNKLSEPIVFYKKFGNIKIKVIADKI